MFDGFQYIEDTYKTTEEAFNQFHAIYKFENI